MINAIRVQQAPIQLRKDNISFMASRQNVLSRIADGFSSMPRSAKVVTGVGGGILNSLVALGISKTISENIGNASQSLNNLGNMGAWALSIILATVFYAAGLNALFSKRKS